MLNPVISFLLIACLTSTALSLDDSNDLEDESYNSMISDNLEEVDDADADTLVDSSGTFGLAGIVDEVNSMRTTWTAGHNFHPDTPASYLKTLAGTIDVTVDSSIEEDKSDCEDPELPKEFDSRKKWAKCPSVSTIYDQGNCGSCWAIAAASTLSDRVCIQSRGKFTQKLSGQALSSCCHVCSYKNGCNGGWPIKAWKFFQRHGLITGGLYNSKEGCQPYLHKPCDHHVDKPTFSDCSKSPTESAPRCKLSCYNPLYQTPWKKDLHKVKHIKHIAPCHAMKEIYHHGPIQASFLVYKDFYTYKSGVYQYTTGPRVGGHSVRVLGWGEENGVPYWLVANSWNEHWGNNGTFKFIRGRNECAFEDSFIVGKPKL